MTEWAVYDHQWTRGMWERPNNHFENLRSSYSTCFLFSSWKWIRSIELAYADYRIPENLQEFRHNLISYPQMSAIIVSTLCLPPFPLKSKEKRGAKLTQSNSRLNPDNKHSSGCPSPPSVGPSLHLFFRRRDRLSRRLRRRVSAALLSHHRRWGNRGRRCRVGRVWLWAQIPGILSADVALSRCITSNIKYSQDFTMIQPVGDQLWEISVPLSFF